MKSFATVILALLTLTFSNAYSTTRTVSNDASGGAQYGDLLSAYNASSTGDTILVEGTNNPSNFNVRWNKNLVVIGIGFNPQKQNPKQTQLGGFSDLNSGIFSLGIGSSGTRFYGVVFTIDVRAEAGISNITFEDCKFNSTFNANNNTMNNLVFMNCVFDLDNTWNILFSNNNASNSSILISNCSFDGYIHGNSSSVLSLTIDHCQFLITNQAPIQNVLNAVIMNSIFMNISTIQSSSSNITYNNNIARLGTFPSGSGNINNTNPNFVSYSNGSLYSASYNFHLQSGSAAIGAATDASDIGIHGGSSFFSDNGEVLITPIIRSLNINNTNAAPNGTLNIQINATKPSDN